MKTCHMLKLTLSKMSIRIQPSSEITIMDTEVVITATVDATEEEDGEEEEVLSVMASHSTKRVMDSNITSKAQ